MLHALPLAAALLLAGCTATGSAAHHGADHPAAPQASAAPHHTPADELPEAAPVYAPSGAPAAHAGHGQMDHGQMDHSMHDHAEGMACQMPCCQEGGSCAHEGHDHAGHAAHAEHSNPGDHAAHADHARASAPSPHTHVDPIELPADAERALREALEAYLAIGDRLAGDSLEGVAERARTLEAASARLEEGHALHAHAEHLATVRAHAAHLAHARDLADARDAFGEMGPAFAHIVAATGSPKGLEVTRFVCGMADAPEGGVWLQRSAEDPRNPYFGSAMLRCHRGQEAL